MKVVYFSNEDVPASHAGAVHTWEVASGLTARGHEVTLVSAAAPGLKAYERRGGVEIIRARSRFAGVKCNLRAAGLLPALAARPWDVVMERYLTLNGLGFVLAAGRGLPYFVEVNGPHLEEILYRWDLRGTRRGRVLTWWVDRQFSRADGACAPNVNIIRPAARARARKIIWGVNGAQFGSRLRDKDETRAFRRAYARPGDFVVLFVGSFRPWQGARELPAIAEAARARAPRIVFWLVGDGEEMAAVKAGFAAAGFKTATFFGWRPHEELPTIMAAADAAVAPFNDGYYPPLREFGFFWAPTKLLECMASGLPVVTSRYPVLDEMVEDGRSGVLVAAGDGAAFGAALAALAENEDTRVAMARRAEEATKERFSWERHCAILEGYLREAAARRKRLRRAKI